MQGVTESDVPFLTHSAHSTMARRAAYLTAMALSRVATMETVAPSTTRSAHLYSAAVAAAGSAVLWSADRSLGWRFLSTVIDSCRLLTTATVLQAEAITDQRFTLPAVVLYQYEVCPFCSKVRAFLDYHKVIDLYSVPSLRTAIGVFRFRMKWWRSIPFPSRN